MTEVERGKRIHCQELNSEKKYTGFFYLDDSIISVDLFGYDDALFLDADTHPIFLRTCTNAFISLYSNAESSLGRYGINNVVHHQRIISNIAVTGPDRWEESDLIKNVTFRIDHLHDLLKHGEKARHLSSSTIGDGVGGRLLSFKVGALTFSVGFGARYSIEHDHPIETWPYFEIEFDEGVPLLSYLNHVICVVQLFSACLGVYLQPKELRIARLSLREIMDAIERHEYQDHHSVEYIWPPKVYADSVRVWHGHSFMIAYDDDELAALQACTCRWIERYPKWQKACSLMMATFSLTNEISSNRLMTAWRWFEEIPGIKSASVISEDHVAKIGESASAKAVELGYANLDKRIVGALKSIGAETNLQRFERLVGRIKATFGFEVLDDEVVSHLMRAVAFRGKIAHGHFGSGEDAGFRELAKSIYAMEALCFLLTVCDLPMSKEGRNRVGMHPTVSDYRNSY